MKGIQTQEVGEDVQGAVQFERNFLKARCRVFGTVAKYFIKRIHETAVRNGTDRGKICRHCESQDSPPEKLLPYDVFAQSFEENQKRDLYCPQGRIEEDDHSSGGFGIVLEVGRKIRSWRASVGDGKHLKHVFRENLPDDCGSKG